MSPPESGEKICPDCAETVKAAARKCKHCGYEFAPRPAQRRPPELSDQTLISQHSILSAQPPPLSPDDIPELLAQLTERSLIAFDESTGRYHLLESVRQYVRDRLLESGEGESWRGHHLAYFLAMAKEAEAALRGTGQRIWIERIDREHDNLRAALSWCRADRSLAEAGLTLCDALYRFWNIRSILTEGREWLEVMLAQDERAKHGLLRAKALNWLAVLAWRQGEPDDVIRPWVEESVAIARELGAESALAESLNTFADLLARQNEPVTARVAYEEAIALNIRCGTTGNSVWPYLGLARLAALDDDRAAIRVNLEQSVAAAEAAGDVHALTAALDALADFHFRHGEFKAAQDYVERSIARAEGLRDHVSLAHRLEMLADLALAAGKTAEARSLGEEGLRLIRGTEDRHSTGWALIRMAQIACHQQDWRAVRQLATEAAGLYRVLWHQVGLIRALEYLGAAAAGEGKLDDAARIWAAYEKLETDNIRSWRAPRPSTLDDATAATQGEVFARARQEGRAMTLEQAVEFALSSSRELEQS